MLFLSQKQEEGYFMDISKRTEKPCSICRKVQKLSEFHKSTASPDGKQSTCKSCVSIANKQAWKKHKDKPASNIVEKETRMAVPRDVLARTIRLYRKRLAVLNNHDLKESDKCTKVDTVLSEHGLGENRNAYAASI